MAKVALIMGVSESCCIECGADADIVVEERYLCHNCLSEIVHGDKHFTHIVILDSNEDVQSVRTFVGNDGNKQAIKVFSDYVSTMQPGISDVLLEQYMNDGEYINDGERVLLLHS